MKFNQINMNPFKESDDGQLGHHYFNLAFEVDFSRKDIIPTENHLKSNLQWSEDFTSKGDILLPHPDTRYNYTPKSDKLTERWVNYIQFNKDLFIDQIFSKENKDFQKFKSRWCWPVETLKNKISLSTSILKDLPGHRMGPHLDNEYIFAVLIVNLCKNKSATTFHEINNNLGKIYEAPKEKGKGLLFLNTPGSLHSFENNSDSDRYISYTTFALNLSP